MVHATVDDVVHPAYTDSKTMANSEEVYGWIDGVLQVEWCFVDMASLN